MAGYRKIFKSGIKGVEYIMKIFGDFVKVFIWIAILALLRFFVEYWIITQHYSLYSTLTGLFFFIIVTYVTYKGLKI